jgi:hypothetical protein
MQNRAREQRAAQASRDAMEEQENAEPADGDSSDRIDSILGSECLRAGHAASGKIERNADRRRYCAEQPPGDDASGRHRLAGLMGLCEHLDLRCRARRLRALDARNLGARRPAPHPH